jgi:hypothetical protein
MDRHGDAKLTDLLPALVECPKARSASIPGRCKGRLPPAAAVTALARKSLETAPVAPALR